LRKLIHYQNPLRPSVCTIFCDPLHLPNLTRNSIRNTIRRDPLKSPAWQSEPFRTYHEGLPPSRDARCITRCKSISPESSCGVAESIATSYSMISHPRIPWQAAHLGKHWLEIRCWTCRVPGAGAGGVQRFSSSLEMGRNIRGVPWTKIRGLPGASFPSGCLLVPKFTLRRHSPHFGFAILHTNSKQSWLHSSQPTLSFKLLFSTTFCPSSHQP
jgi:hypothetical protein